MTDLATKGISEIYELLKQKALDEYSDKSWSGLQVGSLEYLLALLVAEATSLNSQYIDFRSNQAYLSDVSIYRDALQLAENLGLFPQLTAGATTTLQFTGDATTDIKVPLGTSVSSANGTTFVTTSEVILNGSNSYTASVAAVHAEHETITTRSIGNIHERIDLAKTGIIPSQLQVRVNGDLWTRVDHWGDSSSTDKHYRLMFDDFDRGYLIFGDNIRGQRLSADSQIVCEVFTQDKPLSGNGLAVGTLTTLVDSFDKSSNISTVTNTSITSGGKARDSIDKIAADIPKQLSAVTGLMNRESLPASLRRSLDWLADATVSRKFETLNNITVPVNTVYAYPYSTTVGDMTSPQQSELSNVLTNKGELGVQWTVANALTAPLEIEVEVKISNNNLKEQKRREIKDHLVSTSGSSLFHFSQLGFDKSYTSQQLVSEIESVDGVVQANLNKFARIPSAYLASGSAAATASFADVELGEKSTDGYFEFDFISATAANAKFYESFNPTQIGSNFAVDESKNWIVEEIELGTLTDDINGPYVKVDSNGYLTVRQLERVWTNNQFSGTNNYTDKHILRVQFVDPDSVTQNYFYHLSGNDYRQLTTKEQGGAPLNGGTGITGSLSSSDYSAVKFWIYEDKTNQATGYLKTPTGQTLTASYNDANSLYFNSSDIATKIPVGENSHIEFIDNDLNISNGVYHSYGNRLNVRLDSGATVTANDTLRVYTTELNAKSISYKQTQEVFTLDSDNITIRFV